MRWLPLVAGYASPIAVDRTGGVGLWHLRLTSVSALASVNSGHVLATSSHPSASRRSWPERKAVSQSVVGRCTIVSAMKMLEWYRSVSAEPTTMLTQRMTVAKQRSQNKYKQRKSQREERETTPPLAKCCHPADYMVGRPDLGKAIPPGGRPAHCSTAVISVDADACLWSARA